MCVEVNMLVLGDTKQDFFTYYSLNLGPDLNSIPKHLSSY